jgi:DNA repair exonuclease SbcCD ATPase subunit
MANDKYYGYSPKKETKKPSTGVTDVGTRLDRVNPYEFRKGMDVELTSLGISRLQESTPEEREKATETVLKNLEEHSGYYSALVHYMTEFRNSDNKPTFKTFLKEFYGNTAMKEVNDKKDNQMEEPKYDKSIYTLKEAIKTEVKTILEAKKDKEESDDDKDKKASKRATGIAKKAAALDKEIEKLEKEREKNKEKLQPALNKYKDGKLTADEYRKKSKELVDRNKEIVARVKEIEKEKEEISLKEKADRRKVAQTMMERDTHMELLKIVKEAGVSLREGSGGVKMYYEIAKVAYQEGFMAGLKK